MDELKDFVEKCNWDLLNCSDKESKKAIEYLFDCRKLNIDSIKLHKIGYCHEKFKIPDCIRFFGQKESKKNKWDMSTKINGHIILPIYSEMGNLNAFATRIPINESGYPWWNLPKPFHKGNYLFLLDKAKKTIFNKNKVYIVEGYIDALTLFQHGLKNVVAIMGTAYTLRKLALTIRYCNNVCLCFDSDKNRSGDKAKNLSIAILNKYAFCESISSIDSLPLGDDPASFVSKNGIGSFLERERILDDEEIIKICHEVSKGNDRRLLDAK